jgi:hypothetical protein
MTRAMILAAAVAAASLAAGAAQAQPRGAQPPPGDYFQTCRNVSTVGFGRDATMTAECRDNYGRWRQTSLRFDGCGRIENRNGQLSCRPAPGYPPPGPGPGPIGPGPGPGPGGPGMGRSTLTLFSAPNFGGRPFRTEREITNLPKQDNDRAMSLRIEGRRPWMVCTDSDFRGRCQVFDRDAPDLHPFGLAGKISSMRPVR